MPPSKPLSAAAPAPPSAGARKSSRIAGEVAPETKEPEKKPGSTKKRTAEDKAAIVSKKTKPEATSTAAEKPAPASKPKTAEKPSTSSKTKTAEKAKNSGNGTDSAAAAAEKEAEAPTSAPADTGGKGALKLGDKLPKMVLKDNTGGDVDVAGLAGERGVVVFLYPKADTPGCTTQACGFRDHFTEISDLGYDVYGLSKDKPEAQQKWITKKELNYKLLCDPESKLIKRLGAFVQPNNTKRSHFIFEKGTGKLVDSQTGVKPADDPANCLKFIKQYHK